MNSYGLMIMLGFIAALIVMIRRGRKINIDKDFLVDLGLYAMISGIIGARIAYIINFYHREFQDSMRLFDITDGGLNLLGGIIGWFTPIIYIILKSKKPVQEQSPEPGKPPAKLKLSEADPIFWFLKKLAITLPFCVIFALAFARILHVLLHYSYYSWRIFAFWQGGIVFYGGLIMALIVSMFYIRKRGYPVLKVVDLVLPTVILGLAFGRAGCLLNGCCWGQESESAMTITFPKIPEDAKSKEELSGSLPYISHLDNHKDFSIDNKRSLPVIPIQVYASLAAIMNFFILSYIWMKKKRHGEVLAATGIFYGATRFIEEMFRGDNAKILGGMTFSQNISIAVFALGLLGLFYFRRYGRPAEEPAAHTKEEGEKMENEGRMTN